MAADVFVSYARKDRERVVGWIRSLQSTGISVWVDEQAIEGAARWGQMITEAIEQCQAVLLMLSPASAASEHVLREVFLALDERKPILPLFLEPVPIPSGLRYALAGIQHLNLSAEVSGACSDRVAASCARERASLRRIASASSPSSPGNHRQQLASTTHQLHRPGARNG
jgi:TIR domain-containing protein